MIEKTGMADNLPKFIAAARWVYTLQTYDVINNFLLTIFAWILCREHGALVIHSPVILPEGSKMKPGGEEI